MSRRTSVLTSLLIALSATSAVGQSRAPSITVHNGGYAVVRERITLDLERGVGAVDFSEVAAHVEPESVILRAVEGDGLRVLEQNFRNDPISVGLLLSLSEGQTLDFLTSEGETVSGRIVRSGYVPHQEAWQSYGQQYYQRQMALINQSGAGQPIVEVDGQLRFSLPGQPLFPSLTDDSILRPTLHWVLDSDRSGEREVELTYVTGGMRWAADYNLVEEAMEEGERGTIDLTAWVTMDNNSGRSFPRARVKLMAGDVSKLAELEALGFVGAAQEMRVYDQVGGVSEKTFDEYHLYTVERPTDVRDRETKQIQFLHAPNVRARRLYVYDGAFVDPSRHRGWNVEAIRNDRSYGAQSNPKVWVMREIENDEASGLGVPLPKGRFRFYRRDGDELEFVGEDAIDHTPRGERLRLYTGSAFDVVGERVQTDYRIDANDNWLDESFSITLRNRKEEPVEIVVVEHLYRWVNWEIRDASEEYEKTDARTIEMVVELEPDEERVITYTAHYTW